MKDSPVRLSIKLLLTSLFAMMTAIAAMQGVFALVALDAINDEAGVRGQTQRRMSG